MRLAYKAYTLHILRENPSLPRTLDSSFSLKNSSIYIIYPIIPLIKLPIYILTLYLNPY